MLPGVGGLAGRGGGSITLITNTNTTSNTITSGGGQVMPAYSSVEFIAECGPGGGYARSFWLAGSSGAPAVGANISGFIDRRTGSPPTEAVIQVDGVNSVQALASSATGGNVTNNGTGGSAFRITVNYTP